MSFKAYMLFKTEEPKSNALAFATSEEADAYGRDLISRWLTPIGYEVRESDEPVNYRWDSELGRAVPLDSASAPVMPVQS